MGSAEAEAQPLCKVLQALGTRRYCYCYCCYYPIQVSMTAVAIPKATAFNFSSLDMATD